MQIGGASDTVTVQADQMPLLKTDRADVSTTFSAAGSAGSPDRRS